VIRLLPKTAHPDLLVGFDTSDDAGVFRVSEDQALVQTVDFFTPIVDDPYSYGAIAAANSLSDIYAMGGRPITAMNICCFDPSAAPAEIWANVLRGAYDKTAESGAVLVGGHSVEDKEPKFGLSVTGLVDPEKMFANTFAQPGDFIALSKPLGTGIVTTAHKFDNCSEEELQAAIASMATLNREACEKGLAAGVRCATDITGFGLAGHLFNIARASNVAIEIFADELPLLPGLERMVAASMLTGGSKKNRAHIGEALQIEEGLTETWVEAALDPQTSGGLALFSKDPVPGYPVIGRAVESDEPRIHILRRK
jgi:selenide, water dikinase